MSTAVSLSIRMLGPFDVQVNGSPLPTLRSRKGQGLLALLALREGREVARDWLAEALWPDSLEALTSLRQSLSDLRRALGAEAPRLQSPTTRTLRLELAGGEVDVLAFDAAVRRGDPAALAEAVALYQGPLLEGCADPWVLPERETRQRAYLQSLETLATQASTHGDFAAAVSFLRRGAAVDPLRQSLHRALMRALQQAGQLQSAVEVYQALRRDLHREFNAEPDAETTVVYQRIRAEARERGSEGARDNRDSQRGAIPSVPSLSRSLAPSLPLPLTRLIGRDPDLRGIAARLASARLVTLTGPGGMGKTRLAVEVAREAAGEYADGVGFVDLSTLTQPTLVPQSIAAALGLHVPAAAPALEVTRVIPDTGASAGRFRAGGAAAPILVALCDSLRSRQLLLVLDNCEHLLESCAATARALLVACPAVRILATSRERLGLTGEVVWRVAPLGLPEDGGVQAFGRSGVRADGGDGTDGMYRTDGTVAGANARTPERLIASPAVQLFVARAAAVRAEFALSAENAALVGLICRRLDGIPLAIELAAAHVEALPVEEIATRIADWLGLLTGGDATGPERHQTLRAAIDWSYERLTGAEQALLRRVSVFAGGWTLTAAEAVGSGVQAFRRSGVQATNDERPSTAAHQSMLGSVELPNARTPERLTALSPAEVLGLLARLVGKSLVVLDAPAVGPARYRLLETIRQYASEKLESAGDGEAERVRRQHLTFYLQLAEEAEPALTGAEQATWLARLDGEYGNLRVALEEASGVRRQASAGGKDGAVSNSVADDQALSALRLTGALGRYWQIRGLFGEGRTWLGRALAPVSGQASGVGRQPSPEAVEPDLVLNARGRTDASRLTPGASAPVSDAPTARAKALGWAGFLAALQGDYSVARGWGEESLARWREVGDRQGMAAALGGLALVAKNQGRSAAAQSLFEESLALAREVGDVAGVAGALGYLGILAADRQAFAEARALYAESLALRRGLGDPWGTAASLNNLGLLTLQQGDAAAARALLAESLAIRRQLGDRRCIAISLNALGLVAGALGDEAEARACCAESLTLAREIGDRRSIAYSLEAFARLAVGQAVRLPTKAARLGGAAERLRASIGAPMPPADHVAHAAALAAAKEALGEMAFTAAWKDGRTLLLEQAVREALDA